MAGRLDRAIERYRRVLKQAPDRAEALYLLGVALHQAGDAKAAVPVLLRAATADPLDPRCLNVLGLAYAALGQDAAAEASYRRALELGGEPGANNNLGLLLRRQRRYDEAVAALREAVRENPGAADPHYNLGSLFREMAQPDKAAAAFRRALAAEPGHRHALAALGQTLRDQGNWAEAAASLARAIALGPEDAGLHADLGDALHGLRRHGEAIEAYDRALSLEPGLARAWYGAGCAENARKEPVAAAARFRRALDLAPDWAAAQHNLGDALFHLGEVEAALQAFRAAAEGPAPALPRAMIALAIPGDPAADNAAILAARRDWAQNWTKPALTQPRARPRARPARRAGAPLRLGYLSAFFHRPNWMKPVWGLIDAHDRASFEVHLVADCAASDIASGDRPAPGDRFLEISKLDNAAAAAAIEAAGIDILIDLNGYSALRRLPLVALKPAPFVVGWFNYYATSGLAAIDTLIGDAEVVPPGEERFYTETIRRVPGSYLCFAVDHPVPPTAPPPAASGAPFTYGSLASLYKITPETIAAWSRILRAVPASRLLLRNAGLGSADTRAYLAACFAGHGIAPERLMLQGPAPHLEFLATYDAVDLALDTFPYNGGTTTTEAIWQGVPVAAFRGDRWAARTSASILCAAGLGRFVAPDIEAWIERAIGFAGAAGRADLAALRPGLRAAVAASAVCDTAGFARAMEALYREIAAPGLGGSRA